MENVKNIKQAVSVQAFLPEGVGKGDAFAVAFVLLVLYTIYSVSLSSLSFQLSWKRLMQTTSG